MQLARADDPIELFAGRFDAVGGGTNALRQFQTPIARRCNVVISRRLLDGRRRGASRQYFRHVSPLTARETAQTTTGAVFTAKRIGFMSGWRPTLSCYKGRQVSWRQQAARRENAHVAVSHAVVFQRRDGFARIAFSAIFDVGPSTFY